MSFVELNELINVLHQSKMNFNKFWIENYCFTTRELRDKVWDQWSKFAKGVFYSLCPMLKDSEIHKLIEALYYSKDLVSDLYED